MKRILCPTLPLAFFLLSYLPAAEEWESVLQANINSEYSETRHNAVKQVDTKCAKGLKALWNVLAITNPDQVDWYVREGAYEALTNAEGEEAMNEILRLLKAPGNDLAKEAVIYSVIWKIRKQFVKQHGGNDDRKIQEATFLLRKKRGLEYFGLVLPFLKELDPDGKKLEWIRTAFEDKSSRVRRAAITGFMAYPDNSSIPLLIDNLKRLEKKKAQNYREWVQDRFALETLTGEYFRENVEDWARWWEINKNRFGIEKRVEDELEKKEGDGLQQRTTVVREAGVEVTLNMKVAGEKKGYPLLVLPWRHYEPDYFRPYFHGVEEFLRVYYVQMPQFDEFKGLARDSKTNYVVYPTEILAKSLASLMKEGKLEKYAILGHGPDSCVAAMMLASIYPKQVTHLVLINPRSAGSEYDTATINVRKEGTRRKNREIIKGADSITWESENKLKYKASDDAEEAGMDRALSNLLYDEPTGPEVGMLKFLYTIPSSTSVMADGKWSVRKIFKNQKPKMPVMVVLGEKNPWTPISDVMKVVGFFDHPYLAKFPNSSETPFMTDTYAFTQHMEKFFGSVVKGAAAKADKTAKTKVAEKTEKKPEAKKEEKKEEPPETKPEEKPGDDGDKPDDPDDPDDSGKPDDPDQG